MNLRAVDDRWGGTASKWVWSTRPHYVFEDDGSERVDLEPVKGVDSSDYSDETGWWTCHPQTKVNDLAVIYRNGGKRDDGLLPTVGPRDIAYVCLVTSDAFPLSDDPLAGEFASHHGCRFVVIARFQPPIGIAQLRQDPTASDWGALKAGFVQAAMSMPDAVWDRLVELDGSGPHVAESTKTASPPAPEPNPDGRGDLERRLEAWLADHPESLRDVGLDVRVHRRQMLCSPGHGGTTDLICTRIEDPQSFVVLELKAAAVRRDAVAQAVGYVGWLRTRPQVNEAAAVIIGSGAHPQVEWVLRPLSDDLVRVVDWSSIDLPQGLADELNRLGA